MIHIWKSSGADLPRLRNDAAGGSCRAGKKDILSSVKKMAPAMTFVILMGVVSLFSDFTHEGARSIYGAYLSLAGASAAVIGFVSGFGELVGYALIYFTGLIADKSKKYWTMTLIGYAINLIAIPALALVPKNGWIFACFLIIFERLGRAIRKPSNSTLVSFASKEVGEGKAFAVHEFLDQMGAFVGPLFLFFILANTSADTQFTAYARCFAWLAIPAVITICVLLTARKKYPDPEIFEKNAESKEKLAAGTVFAVYIIAISLFAFGFIDFPLITMHVAKGSLVADNVLPLLYSGAMLVDAFAALAFGWMYDKYGVKVLMLSTLISSCFAIMIFRCTGMPALVAGIIMWGVGMGAQESILKSVVATIIPKDKRSRGFGIFEMAFGIAWFLGSWLLGILYDYSITAMVVISVATQLVAIPLFWKTDKLLTDQGVLNN